MERLIIAGGGLAGGLTALALAKRRPEIELTIVESAEALGGNHIWSFFDSDVDAADRWLVDPLIVHRWDGYDVRFPAFRRTFDEPYQSIESERFDQVVRAALPEAAIIRASIDHLTPTAVMLSDGGMLEADRVLDTRGAGDLASIDCGWQKFVGQTLTLERPHGLERPVIMDAAVDQHDGYRFVYLLPMGPASVFVEDTYYSDTPDLDVEGLKHRIAVYAEAQGWTATATNRLETGVLPVVIGGAFDAYWPSGDAIQRGGVRAGLFQPLTSYSLPDAVRFAVAFAANPALDTRAYSGDHWRRNRFNRMLTRMLFKAARPAERYRVLQRFYRMPEPLIARFYAGRSTLADKLRVLAGKPPVPIGRALRAIFGSVS